MPHGVTRLVEDDFIIPSHYPFYFFSFLFSLSLSLSLSPSPAHHSSLLLSFLFFFLPLSLLHARHNPPSRFLSHPNPSSPPLFSFFRHSSLMPSSLPFSLLLFSLHLLTRGRDGARDCVAAEREIFL
jgi:hypothetical protein